jgi:hypothetical protein
LGLSKEWMTPAGKEGTLAVKLRNCICNMATQLRSLLSVSLFSVDLTLEHRASVNRFFFHFSFLILRQSVGLLGRGMSPSQDLYLFRHRKTQTNLHNLRGIRTQDYSVRAGKDSSSLSPCGRCDRRRVFWFWEARNESIKKKCGLLKFEVLTAVICKYFCLIGV